MIELTKLKVRGLKWKRLKVKGSVLHFYFFFFNAWTVTSHEFIVQETKCTVYRCHDTIYTFKNYFATVFSVFNFNKNKLYPNDLLGWEKPIKKLFTYFVLMSEYNISNVPGNQFKLG